MAKIFHPLLSLIASGTERALAKYVEFLKVENKILRARIPSQVHTKPDQRQRLIQLGNALGRAVEELLTIVSVSTFYRWCRDEKAGKKKQNPAGGQRKYFPTSEGIAVPTDLWRSIFLRNSNRALRGPQIVATADFSCGIRTRGSFQ